MTELRKEFKKDHPETIGETERQFDDSNYIDWLEKKLTEAQYKLKNNVDLDGVSNCEHPRGQRRYVGANLIKCGVCDYVFK